MSNIQAMELTFTKFKPGTTSYSRRLEPADPCYEKGKYAVLFPSDELKFGIRRVSGGVTIIGKGTVCTDLEREQLMDAYRRSPKARATVEHVWCE